MVLPEASLARRPQVVGLRPPGQAGVQEGRVHFGEDGADGDAAVVARAPSLAPLLWIGVMAHSAHAGGRLPTCAQALNNAATAGARSAAAARSASTDKKPSVDEPLRNMLAPATMSAAVKGWFSSDPSAVRVACAAHGAGLSSGPELSILGAGLGFNVRVSVEG